MVEVKEGFITGGRVYSDCLYPDFIDFINKILQEQKLPYNRYGKLDLTDMLRNKFEGNKVIEGYIKDL